ncbi:ATP-binding cassette domain-containing protein [Streptomyces sp. NPDC047108]|uniref:ABC transporter ATP-binding protein n=1 Tax=Streptomyces sp. NPDC047108 TaxID=3155025 RepID=UPI0033C63BAF
MRLDALTKRYPDSPAPAVEDVTLDIAAGETVILVGPSGCGKSTTLKMINRLIEPTSGRITIGGEDVTGIDPVGLRRTIGYAIQAAGLFPHMTVAENIALVPKMAGWPRAKVRDRVEEMLHLVGLDPGEFRGRYPRRLSGGQQQRVGVARALAADPPVLLMDEPFGAVDPITRERLQDQLIRLQRELRKTIVFVTHDFDEAVKVGDRIAVLRDRSQIAQFDTPEAILARPADDFVAGFVGAGAGVKRLNLKLVREVELARVPTAGVGDPLETLLALLEAGPASPSSPTSPEHVLLLDRDRRPHAWLRREDLTRARSAQPVTDPLPLTAGVPVRGRIGVGGTLRDALEALLADGARPVAVTREDGTYLGAVDMATLLNAVNATPDGAADGAAEGSTGDPAPEDRPAVPEERSAARGEPS